MITNCIMQLKLAFDGPLTFEGDQLTQAIYYFMIPVFQQMTVVKDQPVAIINSFVQH